MRRSIVVITSVWIAIGAVVGCSLTSLGGYSSGSVGEPDGAGDDRNNLAENDPGADGDVTSEAGSDLEAGVPRALVVAGGHTHEAGGPIPNVNSAAFALLLGDGGLSAWSTLDFPDMGFPGLDNRVVSSGSRIYLVGPTVLSTTLSSAGTPIGWTLENKIPNDQFDTCNVVSNGSIISLGGVKDDQVVNNTWITPMTAPLSWLATAAMPEARKLHGCAANEKFVYTIAGKNTGETHTAENWVAVRTAGGLGAWTKIRAFPATAYYPKAVVIGPRLWIFTAVYDGIASSTVYTATILEDGQIGNWEQRVPLPETIENPGVAVIGRRVIVSGGYSTQQNRTISTIWESTVDDSGGMTPWKTVSTGMDRDRVDHGSGVITISP